jgi:hypothetical protein
MGNACGWAGILILLVIILVFELKQIFSRKEVNDKLYEVKRQTEGLHDQLCKNGNYLRKANGKI